MPTDNRGLLIAGVAILAAVVIALLFFWPGILFDPFDDGNKASATYNGNATSTAPGATVPNPFAQDSGGTCQPGDKVGTWSEIQGAGPQRIEVGGHGTQHLDFYPAKGVKAVSYIVSTIANPEGVPDIAHGFGSIWEWNPPNCAFDHVADAKQYARARLDSGHSGIVVDMRTNPPSVVANVADISQDAINSLLAQHSAAMERGGQPFQLTVTQASAPSVSCDDGVREDRQPVVGQAWIPNGNWRTINFWSNQPGVDQAEHKLLLEPGDNVGLLGGGASFSWPTTCEQAARDAFDKNGLEPVTLDELRQQGLVR